MSSSGRVYDYATGQYVRYSASRKSWVGQDDRPVREPQRTQRVAPSATQSSSRPSGVSSQSNTPSGRVSGANVAQTTEGLRSLSISSLPTNTSSSQSLGQGSSIPAGGYSSSIPVQRPGPIPASQGSGTRDTTPYGSAPSDRRAESTNVAPNAVTRPGVGLDQRTAPQSTSPYSSAPTDQRANPATVASSSGARTNVKNTATSDQRAAAQNTTLNTTLRSTGYPTAASAPRTASQNPVSMSTTRPLANSSVPSNPRVAPQSAGESSNTRAVPYAANAPGNRSVVQTNAQGPGIRNPGPHNATVSDERTGLQTRWEVSETTQFRDPGNADSSRPLNLKKIRQTENRPNRVSLNPERDYKVGRVIEVMLVPPEDVVTSNVSSLTPTQTSEQGEVRSRRFIIVREINESDRFEALAIKTYYGRGVGAPGVIKSHHSIIYTGTPPQLQPDEFPGRGPSGYLESGMLPSKIRVVALDRGQALDPMCRLDYADRYEFDWGVSNIKLFGRVHDESHAAFLLQYNAVWHTIKSAVAGTSYATQSTTAGSTTTVTGPAAPSGTGTPYATSSTAATAGSSARGTTASSSTSGTVPWDGAAARVLFQRYALRNSGPCTYEHMAMIVRYLQEYAHNKGLQPPVVSAQQLQDFALSAERRSVFIQQLRSYWAQQEEEEAADDDDDDDDDDDHESDED